jgi:nitroreductase
VIPCIEGREMVAGENVTAAGLYGSIFPAVWSFQLALRSRGLGSSLTTLHLIHEQEAAALLGIPDDVVQVGLVPVAYFTGDDFAPAARRPARELTYWNTWGPT